jgi:hypothetical protein
MGGRKAAHFDSRPVKRPYFKSWRSNPILNRGEAASVRGDPIVDGMANEAADNRLPKGSITNLLATAVLP